MSYYDSDETDRAVEAFFRHAQRNGLSVDQPNRYDTRFNEETRVVKIRSGRSVPNRVMARYRVTPDGRLRRLR